MPLIDPRDELCELDDAGACMATYEKVRSSVESGLQQLLRDREVDPERELVPRLLGQAARYLPPFELMSEFGPGK
jgi:hypothetical protein